MLVLAVLLMLPLGAALGGTAEPSGGDVLVGPPLVLTRDGGPLDAHNSPRLAVNPRDPDNVVLVHRVDAPFLSASLHVSTDGGHTWAPTVLPLPEGTGRPDGPPLDLDDRGEVVFVETQRRYAPDVAFAADGTLYVAYVNLMGQGNVPANLWLARSDDGGATLSAPTRVAGELAYQGRLAVGPSGTLHVTYIQATTVGAWALTAPAPLVAVRSDDGGRSFSDPVVVSDASRQRVGAASPVVDAEGQLVVLYQDFRDDVRDFQNLEGPAWDRPTALVATRSEDGGQTFLPGVEVDDGVLLARRFIVFLPDFPSLAAGPAGELYVVWTDARAGSEDVMLRRSDDGGRTWTAPVQVNDPGSEDGTSQYLPTVSTSADGRVDVLYLDRAHDPANRMTHVVLASSTDRGVSFETVRLTAHPFDGTIGPAILDAHVDPNAGSRQGLVSSHGSALAAWTDTGIGQADPGLGRQDIAVARVTGLPSAVSQAQPGRWRWLALPVAMAVAIAAMLWRRHAGSGR